jgi:DNA-binding NarL/FixJ family response regulator
MSEDHGGPTRVLVVDDQALMREGLRTLLELDEMISVVGTAANGHEAVQRARVLEPHVVLMDIRMPGMDGIAATRALKRTHRHIQVLVLTTFDDDELIFAALQAGASGYVLKDTPSEQLARDLHAVRRGESSLSPGVARKVIAELVGREHGHQESAPAPAPRIDAEGRESLSERELDVLRLAAEGLSNREIGQRLYITEGTVKNHISSLLSKLHLRDRTQAVLYAREQGLI